MNNRELINNQLNNLSTSNSLFIVKSGNDIQNEIPEQIEKESDQNSVGSVNNFNVNVNVSGSSGISNPRQQVKNILNNVLNVQQPKTPEELKKNYRQDLNPNGNFNYENTVEQIIPKSNFKLNVNNNYLLKTYNEQNKNDAFLNNYLNTENLLNRELINLNSNTIVSDSSPNQSNQIISYNSPDQILEQNFNKQQFVKNSETKNNNNNFSSLINALTIQSNIKSPEINSYTYSAANIKNENVKLNLAFENLHKIIRSSTPQNSTVASTFSNEFTVDQIQNQRNLYENKNFTIQTINQNSSLEHMDNSIRNHDSTINHRNNIIQNQILQIAKTNEKQKEDMELTDEMNDTVPVDKESIDMYPGEHTLPNKDILHINEEYDTTKEEMILKMNSPPIWRTVLG